MSRFSDLYSPKQKEEVKEVLPKPIPKEDIQNKKTVDSIEPKDKN